MIRNKDFALLYAGRAVFSKNGVFMKKPRAGAYYKYIELKNIGYEES